MKNLIKALIITICGVLAVNAQQSVTINFQAVVGEKAFDCKESYEGIGTTRSKMTVSDFKIYVQDVRLVDKNGKETPVSLTNDGKFQTEKVAMLDFENGEGNCASGTKELNTAIRGTAAKGKYSGVKFTIGVPTEINHLDPTLQASPLNITRMMWSWQIGYKFARIDTKTNGRPNGYVLHLGSTNCETDANGKTTCKYANRPEFSFAKFDLAKDVIKVDLKSLFANANVDVNKDKTSVGCMSFPGDDDCVEVFKSLGLKFEAEGNQSIGAQTFMRAEKAAKNGAKNANKSGE
ncbi:MAG TPA: metallo-mystery pair system four-Cys motif protein [Pyrinomonadaceae bacterium]|nr:metallo-mystery pair system four-Cys motif protein [Pyrinomonadaceae bacterium]